LNKDSEQGQHGRPQKAWDARTQSDDQRGQGESAWPDFIEHSDRGEGQQM
jgi:hypothetical protein